MLSVESADRRGLQVQTVLSHPVLAICRLENSAKSVDSRQLHQVSKAEISTPSEGNSSILFGKPREEASWLQDQDKKETTDKEAESRVQFHKFGRYKPPELLQSKKRALETQQTQVQKNLKGTSERRCAFQQWRMLEPSMYISRGRQVQVLVKTTLPRWISP